VDYIKSPQVIEYKDPRAHATERGNYSGQFNRDFARYLAIESLKRGLSPKETWALAVKESTFGKFANPKDVPVQDRNVLRFNFGQYKANNPQHQKELKGYQNGPVKATNDIETALNYRAHLQRKGKDLQAYQGKGNYFYNNPKDPATKNYPQQVQSLMSGFNNPTWDGVEQEALDILYPKSMATQTPLKSSPKEMPQYDLQNPMWKKVRAEALSEMLKRTRK
jgi:hypothetical protein